ncbi:hypothetical protein [Nocardia tengchongensis]|uniref:hypothetical protein n=1 Tax=Nocardia tengchongensis TaxID=2055889 RepID=UPI0036500D0C
MNSWRTLNAQQLDFAGLLLQAAALWITGKCQAANIPVSTAAAKIVSIEVVRAALQRDQLDGVPSGKTVRGDRSDEWTNVRTATIEELAQTLVFSEYHQQLLGLWQPTGPRYAMGNRYGTPDPVILPGVDRWGTVY